VSEPDDHAKARETRYRYGKLMQCGCEYSKLGEQTRWCAQHLPHDVRREMVLADPTLLQLLERIAVTLDYLEVTIRQISGSLHR
jgi:hypothetical protein